MSEKKKKNNTLFFIGLTVFTIFIFTFVPAMNYYNERNYSYETCTVTGVYKYESHGKGGFLGRGVVIETKECGKFIFYERDDLNQGEMLDKIKPGNSYDFRFGDIQTTIMGNSKIANGVKL